MGLIKQIDDQIGRLMGFLEQKNIKQNTLIIFTSDHGDYLGDHWLGEKELFHQQSVKVPLIIVDPSKDADITRGTVNDDLVEAIDLLPTFIDFNGGVIQHHILEGQSLLHKTRRRDADTQREYVISEYDYSMRKARKVMSQDIGDCRLIMIFDGRYKLIHVEGYCPMLYDLQSDPQEFVDLGTDDKHAEIRANLLDKIFSWWRQHHNRVTTSDEYIDQNAGKEFQKGIHIGFWDEGELELATLRDDAGN